MLVLVNHAEHALQMIIIPHNVLPIPIGCVKNALLVLLANTGQGVVCKPVLVHVNHVPHWQAVIQVFTDLDVALPVQEAVHHARHVNLANTYQAVEVCNLGFAQVAALVQLETTGLLNARDPRLAHAVNVQPAVLEPIGLDALVQALEHASTAQQGPTSPAQGPAHCLIAFHAVLEPTHPLWQPFQLLRVSAVQQGHT